MSKNGNVRDIEIPKNSCQWRRLDPKPIAALQGHILQRSESNSGDIRKECDISRVDIGDIGDNHVRQ